MADAPLDPGATPGANDSPATPPAESGAGLGERDSSADTVIDFLRDGSSEGQVGARIRATITKLLDGAGAVVLRPRLEPTGVRGPKRAAVPATLELTDADGRLLGSAPQTQALLGGGELRVWLADLDALGVGATVTLLSLNPDGELLVARAEVSSEPRTPLKLSVSWADADAVPRLVLVVEAGDADSPPP
jgi:hypothetical protein